MIDFFYCGNIHSQTIVIILQASMKHGFVITKFWLMLYNNK
ncbi:MAG: hypothetical protein PHC95_03655 [Parabacteroides sp.]|nr:hypothetical protein [Parabacteroides sp.]